MLYSRTLSFLLNSFAVKGGGGKEKVLAGGEIGIERFLLSES